MGLQSQSQSPLWSSEDDDDGKGFAFQFYEYLQQQPQLQRLKLFRFPRVRRRVMEANFTFNELSVLFHQDNKDHVLLSMKVYFSLYLFLWLWSCLCDKE